MRYTVRIRSMKFSSIFKQRQIQNVLVILLVPISAISSLSLLMPSEVQAQALRSTRLDAKLVEAKSRVIDNSLIESTFKATVRAYGGDIYLPAHADDIVYKPEFTSTLAKSNAIIPGSAIIRVEKELPSMNGRYVLKEYEEADITIVVTSKVIPSAITTERLVFKTELTSLIWKPVIQQYNEDEVGNPLLDISPLNWKTNPVIVWKKMPTLALGPLGQGSVVPGANSVAAKSEKKNTGLANAFGIFNQLGKILGKN